MRIILHVMCPEKQWKPVQAEVRLSWALSGPLALSHLKSGHAVPFSPQDFCICVYLSLASTTQDPAGRNLHHKSTEYMIPCIRGMKTAKLIYVVWRQGHGYPWTRTGGRFLGGRLCPIPCSRCYYMDVFELHTCTFSYIIMYSIIQWKVQT